MSSKLADGPAEFLDGGEESHPNPMYDYLTGFMPRKLKDLFRWTEYLYYKSPHIFAALSKMSDYIITDISYQSEQENLRDRYKQILEKDLRIKAQLKVCARDRMVYGNSFVSVYTPFKRMVPMKGRNELIDIQHLDYEYDWETCVFTIDDPDGPESFDVHIDDMKEVIVNEPSDINIIRWDPKHIDIDYNRVTGENVYYYNFPSSLKEKIKEGHNETLNHMPSSFLKAVKEKKSLRFNDDRIYHMRIDAPAGVDHSWGFPPLTATLGQFFYTQMLRKANEAIALDHLVPFRVLHPQQTGKSNDPVQSLSLGMWVEEMKDNLKQWRQDPLHIMFAPVALGVTQMGGQGRQLLTLGEVKEAEANILAGMGLPKEFLFGGLSYTGSSVTLRMLENQLRSHTAQVEKLLQWICDQIAEHMGWEEITTDITPFKMVDDVQQKSMMLKADSQYGIMSKHTIADLFDIDYDEEKEQRKEEILNKNMRDREIQREMKQQTNALAEKAKQQAMQGQGLGYDQQQVIAEAERIAKQLMEMEEGPRRSKLRALEKEDAVMYAVVRERMEQLETNVENRAEQKVEQQMKG